VSVFEALRVAVAALRAHKLRSFLNFLGVVIAVTTIVAVVAVVSGLNGYAASVINQLGPNTMILSKFGIITSRDQFLQALKRKDIDRRDLEAVRRLVPGALRISGRVFGVHSVYGEGKRLRDVFVVGTESEFPMMVGLEIEDGRWFTRSESDAARPVAVIGWDLKRELFPRIDPIGRMVKIQGRPFRVVGLMRRQGRAFGQSQDNFVAIPLWSFEKAFGRNRSLDIFIEAPDAASRPEVEDAARMVLRARRGTRFRDPDPFDVVDASALQTLWRNLTLLAFALVTVISSITLAVGGVAIANTMFASIVERTHEIGVRKAVGARRRDIRRQFLLEAVLLAVLGGLLGVAIGWGVAALVTIFSPFPAVVRPSLVGTAMLVAALTGVVAGWLPAARVSRLDPVVALREE
jgi:putative ABC transport system permease protein